MRSPLSLGPGAGGRSRAAAQAPVAAVWVGLAVLAVLQAPGLITFDTKLDLAVEPGALLRRALQLWDPDSGVGPIGNQAYGYLFPVLPFYLLGDALGLPAWLVQRLWTALVLVVAFEGARRLVTALGGVGPGAALVCGLVWALSPRAVTVIGHVSSEALPAALLPWALLPLLGGAVHRPRRAAVRSALAVLCMGGVNAVTTLAVLVVPLLWLVTRPAAVQVRVRAVAWWGAAVLGACAWWLGPLLVSGPYQAPFLQWTETASETTAPLDALAVTRGASHWVGHLADAGGAVWPAAAHVAVSTPGVLATTALAALGLWGLCGRRVPERGFAVLTLGLGLVLLGSAHTGPLDGVLAEQVRDLLEGPAAPLRNVHKFDPLVRLPLLLGLAAFLAQGGPRMRAVVSTVAVVAVAATAQPALSGDLRLGTGFRAVPGWWEEAAAAVGDDGTGRALVVPGAGFGLYRWGSTYDEPLQPLADGPWAVRDQAPLTPAGRVRFLESVDAVLATGRGSAGLASALARSGIGRLVVRNDLEPRADGLRPALVRASLEASPGLRRTAAFGPRTAPHDVRPGHVVDGGLDLPLQAVEIWDVDSGPQTPYAVERGTVPLVSGGPEDLVDLLASGALDPGAPAVLAGEDDGSVQDALGPWLVTDGLQRREQALGRVHGGLGPVLVAPSDEDASAVRARLPFDGSGHQTVARYDGLVDVTASSSGAGAPIGDSRAEQQPYAAVDGDITTAWTSGAADGPVGEWLEVRLPRAVDLRGTSVRLARGLTGSAVTRLRVETDAGRVDQPVLDTSAAQVLQVPDGTTRSLRLTVLEVAAPGAGQVGVLELAVPGVEADRTLVLPDDAPEGRSPASVLVRVVQPSVPPCVVVAGAQRCDPWRARPGDERDGLDRTFSSRDAATWQVTGRVVPRPGEGVQRLMAGGPVVADASSYLEGSVTAGPGLAVDGDPSTAWVAGTLDPAPELQLSFSAPREVRGVRLEPPSATLGSAPRTVEVAAGDVVETVTVGPDGELPLSRPVTTDRVVLRFLDVERVTSISSATGWLAPLPLAVAEAHLVPPAEREAAAGPTGALCGFGPVVEVDGRAVPTEVRGSLADLRAGRTLELRGCGEPLLLPAGAHRLTVQPSEEFEPASVLLQSSPTPPVVERAVDVLRDERVRRDLRVAAGGAALLVVPEVSNAGWEAVLDGERLAPRTVDGWQQAWAVPAGEGGVVSLRFRPETPYRWALALGGLAAAVIAVAALVAGRRTGRADGPQGLHRRGGPRSSVRTPARAAAVAAVLLLLGPVGLVGAVAGAAAAVMRPRWAGPGAAALLVAAALAAVQLPPGRDAAAAVQVLALSAVGWALAAAVVPAGRAPVTPR